MSTSKKLYNKNVAAEKAAQKRERLLCFATVLFRRYFFAPNYLKTKHGLSQ